MPPFFSTSPEPIARRRARRAAHRRASGFSRVSFCAIPGRCSPWGVRADATMPPIPRCRSLGRRAVRRAFLRRGFQRRDRPRASRARRGRARQARVSEAEHGGVPNRARRSTPNPLVIIGAAVAFRRPAPRRSSSARAPAIGATPSISSPARDFTIISRSIASASSI